MSVARRRAIGSAWRTSGSHPGKFMSLMTSTSKSAVGQPCDVVLVITGAKQTEHRPGPKATSLVNTSSLPKWQSSTVISMGRVAGSRCMAGTDTVLDSQADRGCRFALEGTAQSEGARCLMK